MGEFSPPDSAETFDRNFAPVKPAMNATEAHYESARCLFCYDAPCVQACPTGIDIPLFIRQINNGNVRGASHTIYASNYLGHACGKVCPTEVLCEGACVYNGQEVKPIEIGRLQSFTTSKTISSGDVLFTPGPDRGKKVAVIGAGPAGLACAAELRRHGVQVVVYEAQAQPSGLALYGVAPYKITNAEAVDEVMWLKQQLGFELQCNHPIRTRVDLEMLEAGFDAIFIGVGLGATRRLGVPNETLDNIHGAAEFIAALRIDREKTKVGKKVIVIGGGNTAMDAASECARLGAEQVVLAYRGSRSQMSAYDFEFDLAKSVGVKGLFHSQPVEYLGATRVTGVRFARTREENGKTVLIPNSEFIEPCDMVVSATGQEKQVSFASLIPGLLCNEKGCIRVDEHFRTHNARYFAAGDCVNGGKEIVNAVAEGKRAAQGILQSFQS